MKIRHRHFAAVVLAAALVFAPHSAVQAEESQASSFSYRDWFCSWGQTWVTTSWGAPGLQSVATIDGSIANFCDTPVQTDAGNIAVRQKLIAWDARGFEFTCNDGDWQINNARGHEWWTWWVFQRPCNTNWYKGVGYSGIRWNGIWSGMGNNAHHTGWIWQG